MRTAYQHEQPSHCVPYIWSGIRVVPFSHHPSAGGDGDSTAAVRTSPFFSFLHGSLSLCLPEIYHGVYCLCDCLGLVYGCGVFVEYFFLAACDH